MPVLRGIVKDDPPPLSRSHQLGEVGVEQVADAEAGDLFAGHIALEGKPISDPLDQLGDLRRAFKLRSSYAVEIGHALDFGWFIIRFPKELKPSLAAKRMIWCVRTILIARSAEAGKPIFAPGELGQTARSAAAHELLSARRRRNLSAPTLSLCLNLGGST
jgi:hypothetical protein